MEQTFNQLRGITTALHPQNEPVTSMEDAVNMVFNHEGVAEKRAGQTTIGIIDNLPSETTKHFILSNTETQAAKQAKYNEVYAYKNFTTQDLNKVAVVFNNQENIKVDRSSSFHDYNPKQGFNDVVLSYAGQASFGWIGNNGVSEGCNNSIINNLREDLYRVFNNNSLLAKTYKTTDSTPMFSTIPSKLFDSADCYPNYNFINIGQYNLITGDNNLVYRNIQPKDIDVTYNTNTAPVLSENSPYFTNVEQPARCWVLDYAPDVALACGGLQNTVSKDGWLLEDYAIQVYVRVAVYREDNTVIYGQNSSILEIKNIGDGYAIPVIAPVIDFIKYEGVDAHSLFNKKNSYLEVFRTKKYRWRGLSIEQMPNTFYKCYSQRLDSISTVITGIIEVETNPTTDLVNVTATVSETQGLKIKADIGANYGGEKFYTLPANTNLIQFKVAGTNKVYSDLEARYFTNVKWHQAIIGANSTNSKLLGVVHDENLATMTVDITGFTKVRFCVNTVDASLYFTNIFCYNGIQLKLGDESLFLNEAYSIKQVAPLSIGKIIHNNRIYFYNLVLNAEKNLNFIRDIPSNVNPLLNNIHYCLPDYGITAGYYFKTAYLYNSYNFQSKPLKGNILSPNNWLGFDIPQKTYDLAIDLLKGMDNQYKVSTASVLSNSYIRQYLQAEVGILSYETGTTPNRLDLTFTNIITDIPDNGVCIIFAASAGKCWVVNLFTYTEITLETLFSGDYRWKVKLLSVQPMFTGMTALSFNHVATTTISCFATFVTSSGFNNIPLWLAKASSYLSADYDDSLSQIVLGKGCYCFNNTTADSIYSYERIDEGVVAPHAILQDEEPTLYDVVPVSYTAPTGWDLTFNAAHYLTAVTPKYLYIQGIVYQSMPTNMLKSLDLQEFTAKTFEKRVYTGLNTFFSSRFLYSALLPLSVQYANRYCGKRWKVSNNYADENNLLLAHKGVADAFDTSIPQFVTGTPTGYPSTADMTNLQVVSTHKPAGIVVSDNKDMNFVRSYLVIDEIGNSNNAINAVWSFNGFLYVSKDEEGIYKIFDDGVSISSTLIDRSRWCISFGTVQIAKDFVLFLSNKGVTALDKSDQLIETSTVLADRIESLVFAIKGDSFL
jgi:hypothetical protein